MVTTRTSFQRGRNCHEEGVWLKHTVCLVRPKSPLYQSKHAQFIQHYYCENGTETIDDRSVSWAQIETTLMLSTKMRPTSGERTCLENITTLSAPCSSLVDTEEVEDETMSR